MATTANPGSVLKLDDELIVRSILAGKSETVSWPHRSQYIGTGGVSACGLAALNCARVLLGLEQQDEDVSLLLEMIKKSTFEQILEICSLWTSPSHLDVDSISESLLFSKTLDLKSVEYFSPSLDNFSRALSDMKIKMSNCSSAVIITRTPEIIACLRIVSNQSETYVVFDSHMRPNHPQGAAFIFFGSIQEAASYLADLFQVDPELLRDTSMQWEAQLFSHFSAHIFGSRRQSSMLPQDWFDAVVESSITFLEQKASISTLQEDKRSLQGEVDRLSSDNARLDNEILERDYQSRRAQKRRDPYPPADVAHEGQSYASASNPRTIVAPGAPGATRASGSEERATSDAGLAAQMRAMFEEEDRAAGSAGSKEPVNNDTGLAARMPGTFEEEEEDWATGCSASGSVNPPGSVNASTMHVNDDSAVAAELQRQFEQEDLEDVRFAAAKQREYEQEHNHLMSQWQELKSSDPGSFECGICLEEHSTFSIARVDACGHQFCRKCMQKYVESQLGEHRFPILCPLCVAEPDKSKSCSIPNEMVQQIGLSNEDYKVFIELEMAAFSILLHCRKCEQSVFVDRREHDEVNIIACPLPNCNHIWCKNCSREVEIGGPQHSCDGTSELHHLMKSRGWKHCPGCRTPVEKSQGCNHMTCMAPGCNTHFCYVCGESIVKSVRRLDIQRAVAIHYRRCRLFQGGVYDA